MTTKKLLNKTSTKKRDTMVTYSNQIASAYPGQSTYTVGPAVLQGAGSVYIFPWIASARPGFVNNTGDPAYAIDMAARTSTSCYMRGLKENVEITTSNGTQWQWRRIAFTLKGGQLWNQETSVIRWSMLTSSGMMRNVNGIGGTVVGSNFVDLVFKGTNGVDWVDIMNAPMDTLRITPKYDKTRIIQSGNASGVMRKYNIWHPMNKNLQFADEEDGGGLDLGRYSTSGRYGMGDYYVVDIIKSADGSQSTDQLKFGPQASLYWHEK